MRNKAGWAAITASLLIVGCSGDKPETKPEVGPSAAGQRASAAAEEPKASDLRFVVGQTALDGFRQVSGSAEKLLILESISAGVGLIDYDRDGDLDVYLTNAADAAGIQSGVGAPDALYKNLGDGRFEEVTAAAGVGDTHWTCGVRVADFDGDGWPDIYLSNYGRNTLYRNKGDETFEDVTESAGVGDESWSTGACFLDYDKDGDLDLYVANYIEFDPVQALAESKREEYMGISVAFGPRGLPGASDRFYRNDGAGKFSDVSQEVGIAGVEYFGFQTVCFDYDGDGWIDIYVANDSQQNVLWRNDGKGHFEDVAFKCGLALSMDGSPQAGMGVALGDFDGDLDADLYVTNFAEDYFTLYRGEKGGFFTDVTTRMKMRSATLSSLGWGCGFADFDNDGDLDLYAVNGHVYPQADQLDLASGYRQLNLLFENDGEGGFAAPAGIGGPGFAVKEASRGSVVGDIDNDGDLDLLIGNLDGPPTLLINETPNAGHSVIVELRGKSPNTDAIGARVIANIGERQILRLVGSAGSFLSSDDPRLHFGLGAETKIEQLEITWPDGTSKSITGLEAGKRYVIEQGQGVTGSAALGG